MKGYLFSPLWYRVAELKPRLRSHVEIHRHYYRKELWYVLQDHSSGRFQRFTPAAYLLIGLMDGNRSVQEIWETGNARIGDEAPTQEEMIHLLSQLHAVDVLQCNVPPDTAELLKRYEQQRFTVLKQNLICPLFMRFPLLDPEDFLNRCQKFVRPLFSWFGVIFWLVVVGSAIFMTGIYWPALTKNITDRVLTAQNLLLLWLIFPVLKAFHEFGHAFAIKVWGGEVHDMGIMMLVLTPVPYVDASSASAFQEKWKRIIVGAAGMIVELFIASLALFVWINTEPGLIRAISYNVIFIASVSSLLFNGNPLLRFDAYYILIDLLEIPNLETRGTHYISYLIQRYLFGLKDVEPLLATTGEHVWFIIYSFTSFAYKIFIYICIIIFISTKFFVIGIILGIWGGIGMVVLPAVQNIRHVSSAPNFHRKKNRAIAVCILLIAAVLALLFLMPVPIGTITEGVLWIPEQSFVRAGTDGFIDRLITSPGTKVKSGEPLIQCSDPLLPARIRVLESQLRELEAYHYAHILSNPVQAAITEEEMENVRAKLQDARERTSKLTIRSNADGTFVVPIPQDLPGRFVSRGEMLGYVVDPSLVTIRVVAPQSNVHFIRDKTLGINARLADRVEEILPARMIREVPAATDQLPSRALGREGGGDVSIDPRDVYGTKAFQKIFLFDLALMNQPSILNVGSRVYVRFDHGKEPFFWRWYRAARRLFLRRFNV